ncbi:MAG: hypothetical protein MUO41_04025, partial [Methyloceanibacter sp.]|nr:hypothetical protein [Methyloceanibacter sp.]
MASEILMTMIKASDSEQQQKAQQQLLNGQKEIQLGHKATDGQTVFLDFEDESAGTIQLLSIIVPIFRALDEGR